MFVASFHNNKCILLQILSLKSALGAVLDITDSWYCFGIQLGMSKEILDGIKHHENVRSMIDVLDKWLKSNQEASWRILFKAKNRLDYRLPESSYVSFSIMLELF